MTERVTRRTVLAAGASSSLVALSGCLDTLQSFVKDNDARDDAESVDDPHRPRTIDEVPEDTALPLSEASVPLAHDHEDFESEAVWGGVGKDGIPSIDRPQFESRASADERLNAGEPIFGVEIDGDPRAYPQYILVSHEIVNDGFEDRGIAVTYCPLTGTAIGFERGSVEFGVSGMLVNNNLIMYDRETDSWWPQILGTGVLGARNGLALEEIRVTWTTWERWRDTYPDTIALTEETGHALDYGRDPYGSYNPRSGYYSDDTVTFPLMNDDDRYPPKKVFIGARSADGVIAFDKEAVRDQHLLEGTVDGVPYVAVYHHSLDSGWVYRNPESRDITSEGDGYRLEGERYTADALPLDAINAFDAMWFAWAAFYPDTVVVE